MVDARIENFYREKLASASMDFMREIYADLREYCLRDGKRIRPLILLASYLGFSPRGKKSLRGVIGVGAALELMHAFLLVQDDIIDKSDSRRGKDSLHVTCAKRYGKSSANPLIGTDVALVAGDVLFSNALEMISGADIGEKNIGPLMKYFGLTYERTAWGQIYDSLNSMPADIEASARAALDISILKTAHYTVHYPMVMGYVLTGGRDRKVLRAIRDAALPMGLAFQLRDDILGVFGDSVKTGKPADSDILEGKMTALVAHTILTANAKARDRFIRLFLKRKKTAADIGRVRELMRESGALDHVRAMIHENAQSAGKGLARLGIDDRSSAIFKGLIERIADVHMV